MIVAAALRLIVVVTPRQSRRVPRIELAITKRLRSSARHIERRAGFASGFVAAFGRQRDQAGEK
jgi:hypothetical protein